MRARVGIEVDVTGMRAVAMRGEKVVWQGTREVPDEDLALSITQLLQQCECARGARLTVALGEPFAKVRTLHGLDAVRRADLVLDAARAGVDRYFIGCDGGVEVSSVRRTADRSWQAGVFAKPVLAALESASEATGVDLQWIVPAVLTPRETRADCEHEFAVACGAALRSGAIPLALSAEGALRRRKKTRRTARMTLAAACVLALVSNVIAPSVVAEMRRRDAEAELARNREALRAIATSMADLTRVSATLGTIERFAGSRRSMLRYLALLADALPESTAVLSIRADSVAATVVLVTRAGPAVVERLSSVAMVEAPQILGPFSREQVGGVEVERVATRSSFRRTVSREAPDQ